MPTLDTLLKDPVRFIPPGGPDAEWRQTEEWTPAEWSHWLREHNKYSFLKQWTEEEIHQYVHVDRYRYGLGFGRKKGQIDHWVYNPTPVAVPFHSSKTPNILFGGAVGGTKSYSARYDAYRHAFAIPEFSAIIMRRTLEELERDHIDKARRECAQINELLGKPVMNLIEKRHLVEVNVHGTGKQSTILFGHCQHDGDENKYLGPHYDAFYPDEMATFIKKQITGIAGRLRTKKRGLVPRMAGTSNPGGGHTLWLKDYFIDKDEAKIWAENPRYRASRYQFLPAMLYDNPYYMDPDGTYTNYEDRLFAYDPERRAQLLLGDWDALTGQFFPEFSKDRHVAVLNVPPGCKVERWVDWGYDPHYGMVLFVAVLPNGRLYVFAEWKFNGATAKEKLVAGKAAERLKQLTPDFLLQVRSNRVNRSIADPTMWSHGSGATGEDYAETWARNGVPLIPADNDRVMGWGRLRHWFMLAPDGLPWMMIHPSCTTTIRTIPTLVRDKNDPDDIDTTGEDHPADCLRYGVMGRPSPVVRTQPLVIPSDSAKGLWNSLKTSNIRLPGMVM